jgi:uncharacterized membrane protein YeaQ/YmgE (transglycosylase-associated protein family)
LYICSQQNKILFINSNAVNSCIGKTKEIMTQYIIQTIVGMAGGWLSSYLGKGSSMGPIANLVLGAVGGNGGGALLGMLGGAGAAAATGAATGGDMQSMLMSGVASLVGGGGLTALSSFLPKGNA